MRGSTWRTPGRPAPAPARSPLRESSGFRRDLPGSRRDRRRYARSRPARRVDHLGVDADGEVVEGLHQHEAEGHRRQGDEGAATVAPEVAPGVRASGLPSGSCPSGMLVAACPTIPLRKAASLSHDHGSAGLRTGQRAARGREEAGSQGDAISSTGRDGDVVRVEDRAQPRQDGAAGVGDRGDRRRRGRSPPPACTG